MLLRFSLYGFLKNLRLFEAFLVLALRERGLDFLAIGSLVAVREVTVHLLEVPSGALADALGRRRCMVASFAAYVASYLLLGLAGSFWPLAAAMALYGVGDAFRSGTHKALIHSWLRQQGRLDERTRVYGFTRSWSKTGSALSSLLGGLWLLAGSDYASIFLVSAVPAALNLLNLATYPASLDLGPGTERGRDQILPRLAQALGAVRRRPSLRSLVAGSALLQGAHGAVKDYVQPLLQTTALGLGAGVLQGLDGRQRTALVVALVAGLLHLLSATASRNAHRLERGPGGPRAAVRSLEVWMCLGYLLLLVCLLAGRAVPGACLFVALATAVNLWRPIQIGLFDEESEEAVSATVLSIESQASALTTALAAPAIGALVDLAAAGSEPVPVTALWPAALVALVLQLAGLLLRRAPATR